MKVHKDDSDRLAPVLLVLVAAALVGMVVGSWELVLYPTLLTVGTLLAMALARRGLAMRGLAIAVTTLLLVLYGVLHAMGIAAPSGDGTVLGWDPMTALYLFLVGPAFLLVGLLHGLLDRPTPDTTDAHADREALR